MELAQLLEMSPLPEERRLFFQAALLQGYDTEQVMSQLFAELEESLQEWQQELDLLSDDSSALSPEEIGQLLKKKRAFQKALRKSTLEIAERRIQEALGSEEQREIDRLRAQLQS